MTRKKNFGCSTSEALVHARSCVSKLSRHGSQWIFHTWSSRHRAWWQGRPQDYFQARAARSVALVEYAASYLGYDDEDCIGYDYENKGGSWEAYIRDLVKKSP